MMLRLVRIVAGRIDSVALIGILGIVWSLREVLDQVVSMFLAICQVVELWVILSVVL